TNLQRLRGLYSAFLEHLESTPSGKPPGKFAATLEAIARELLFDVGGLASWRDTFFALRRRLTPTLRKNSDLQLRGNYMWQEGRAVLAEVAEYAESNRRLRAGSQAQALSEIGQALLSVTDVATL